ncbi:MAG: patatin-like phospholipase family protein [Pseudomonadota bacterium]
MNKWLASEFQSLIKPWKPEQYDREGVGVSFSGGGYRATLFHAGAVLRMNELGVLGRIDRISSVSGGSITSALLAVAWPNLGISGPQDIATSEAMKTHFIKPILNATSKTLDVPVGIAGFLPFVSAGNLLANRYDKHIFHDKMIKDIPEHPKFIFNATNLQTMGSFRFMRDRLYDWRAVESTTKTIRLSEAVAASSGFPPVLAPLRLDLSGETVTFPPNARYDDPALHRRPVLLDGGVYGNLGMEPIWKNCGVLIGSYAGKNADADPSNFTTGHLLKMIDIFLASSIDWRERMLVAMFRNIMEDGLPERAGTYWTAGTDIAKYPIMQEPDKIGWKPSSDELKAARETPTRLQALDFKEQEVVIKAGYTYADAGIRSYLMPDAEPPSGPPDIG